MSDNKPSFAVMIIVFLHSLEANSAQMSLPLDKIEINHRRKLRFEVYDDQIISDSMEVYTYKQTCMQCNYTLSIASRVCSMHSKTFSFVIITYIIYIYVNIHSYEYRVELKR